MLIKVFGAAVQGIDALVVTIEVNCTQGIRFFLVGLPDAAVKESHERIVSAVQHNGYKFPRRQIVINMAPADIRKEGSAYDLPLAVGILASAELIKPDAVTVYDYGRTVFGRFYSSDKGGFAYCNQGERRRI